MSTVNNLLGNKYENFPTSAYRFARYLNEIILTGIFHISGIIAWTCLVRPNHSATLRLRLST